jgi:hypothetical protein
MSIENAGSISDRLKNKAHFAGKETASGKETIFEGVSSVCG